MPRIKGNIVLAYNPYADRAHCIAVKKTTSPGLNALSFSISKTIEQGKFIQDGDTINLEGNYDEIINYNYLQAWIAPYGGAILVATLIPAYFFITSYSYLNNETTAVTIELDSVQTYYNYIDQLSGHLARSHAPRLLTLSNGQKIINPDLYYAEDDPIDSYVTSNRNYLAQLTGASGMEGGKTLLLILNANDEMFQTCSNWQIGSSSFNTNFAALTCNPANTAKYGGETNLIQDYGWTFTRSSLHQSTIVTNSSTYEQGYSYRMALRSHLDFTLPALGSTTPTALKQTFALKGVGNTQLIALIIQFPEDDEQTISIDTFNPTGDELSITFKWGLDSLLWLGPLLADKIVAAVSIPPFLTSSLTESAGFYTLTPNASIASVTCDYETGLQSETENEEYADVVTLNIGSAWLCTDLHQLTYILGTIGGVGDRTNYAAKMVEEKLEMLQTDTEFTSERTISNEKKLALYPYSFVSVNYWGTTLTYKYQDLAPFYASENFYTSDNTPNTKALTPFYCVDPLASSPTIYAGYLAQLVSLYPFDVSNGLTSFNNALISFTENIDSSITETNQITLGYGRLIRNTLGLVKMDPDTAGYLPSYAVYQDSYQEYLNYSKALAVVNNEYSYQTAGIQKSQTITNGVLGVLGGMASVGLGAAAGGLLGGSTIGSGAGNIASGIAGAVYAGQTYNLQTNYIYDSQLTKEASLTGKPPSQTGGSTGNNAISFTLQSENYVIVSRMTYPVGMLNQLEQRFYRWGYAIPEDVVLEGDSALSELPWLKSQFFYIQFDNVQSISFKFNEFIVIVSPTETATYFNTIPMIYQQDICKRLCNGITFVRADGNDGDVSTLKIDYSKDNSDSDITAPLYNRWWTT